MNDRYLFKAKRIDNGKWVVGSYVYTFAPDKECPVVGLMKENHFIIEQNGDMCIIDPSTLCACTGLKDKHGTLIWENDVVYARCNGLSGKGVVQFENGCFVLKDHKRNRTYSLFGEWKFRIDGNIFDNPELLEVEE